MGQTDVPLSNVGHTEASDAVALLRVHPIDYVVSSSLQRCLATASPFCDALGYKMSIMPQLAERAWGGFEGLPKAERGRESKPDGGESDEQFRDRIYHAITELPKQGHTLVVAHSGVFRELIRFGYSTSLSTTKASHAVPIALTISTRHEHSELRL